MKEAKLPPIHDSEQGDEKRVKLSAPQKLGCKIKLRVERENEKTAQITE